MTCPNCTIELSDRGLFCKGCGKQAKCADCRALLESAAAACVECGTLVGQLASSADQAQAGDAGTALAANRNTLSYSEDRNTRRFEASLTDSAMNGLGDVFGELFAQRGVNRAPLTARSLNKEIVVDETRQLPPPPVAEPTAEKQTPTVGTHHTANPDKDQLLRIFSLDGETLELAENRLKAKSAADYYKRLTYLFVYAQEVLMGRTAASKTELVTVLKQAKVYDANCRFWLKQQKGFTFDSEERLKLNAGGREEAKVAVTEILDNNVPDPWNPDKKKTPKPRGTRKNKS